MAGHPGSIRCTVMLTFDMDGVSGMLRRDPDIARRPSVLSQGEFGPLVGAPRILELLKAYDIPSSFFIPGYVAEHHPEAVRNVHSQGHEVAHHGYLHEPPASLGSREEEAEILDRASKILTRITGEPVRGYRSPSWDISEWTLDLLIDRGFEYDSSLMDNDVPYAIERRGRRLVELPVHWSLDDAPYYSFNPAVGRVGPLLSPQIALDTWMWEFDRVYERGPVFMLTMHPYLSGHHSRLEALERLIRHIRARPGVEFKRCIDVARDARHTSGAAGSPQRRPRGDRTSRAGARRISSSRREKK
ncbi:MAG: polysaccharide deacetylase [Chloroflexi bacterium]|nr:polysaccharide deacetylase [Chloroflexota bacterium]